MPRTARGRAGAAGVLLAAAAPFLSAWASGEAAHAQAAVLPVDGAGRPDVLLSAQNEELDAYNTVTGERTVVIPRREFVNGQICPLPDGRLLLSGDPEPPYPRPFIGWGVYSPAGALEKQITTGTDIDPAGCAFDAQRRLFASDVGDQAGEGVGGLVFHGRLLEFFPPDYSQFCVLDDEIGPGIISFDEQGNLYVPEPVKAAVWRYSAPFPSGPGDCVRPQRSAFIEGDPNAFTPSAITRTPWGTWAVSSTLIPAAVQEYDLQGKYIRSLVAPSAGGNPFGLTFDSAGNLYYADLALGPDLQTQDGKGTVRKVAFTDGKPSAPVTFGDGLSFPDGVLALSGQQASALTEWPTYGHDVGRSFNNPFSLVDRSNVASLSERWFLPTEDAVTAQPALAGGTLYVGDWNGDFHAVDADTGKERWRFAIDPNNAIYPHPGARENQRRLSGDGGQITSSATVADVRGRTLVFFGGGKHVYALDAATGALVWKTVLPGNPEADPEGTNPDDEALVQSSPVVFGDRVYVGMTTNGQDGGRGYFVALDAVTGNLVWRFETDPDPASGIPRDRGCGGVWGSPTLDESRGVLVFGVADCASATEQELGPYNGRVVAVDADSGHARWVFSPPRPGFPQDVRACDFDFGANVNLMDVAGRQLLGFGGKDGTYYAVDRDTGDLAWSKRVVQGGASGGFIIGTAYDGKRVYGATAFGQFGADPEEVKACAAVDPGNTIPFQDPSFHALDAGTGAVAWQKNMSYSFAATVVSGGVVLNGKQTFAGSALEAYDADGGDRLASFDLKGPVYGTGIVAGRCVYSGTGGNEQYSGVGLHALCLEAAQASPTPSPTPAPTARPAPTPSASQAPTASPAPTPTVLATRVSGSPSLPATGLDLAKWLAVSLCLCALGIRLRAVHRQRSDPAVGPRVGRT